MPNPSVEPKEKNELYQLDTDPMEIRNLADSEKAKVLELQAKLNGWWMPGR